MASLPVVGDLDVIENRVRQVDPGPPFTPNQELDLHAELKRLHRGVVVVIADRAKRGHQPNRANLIDESPQGGLDCVVGVDNSAAASMSVLDRPV